MNKVILLGYLGQDPTPRTFEGNKVMSRFSIAVSDLRNYAQSYFFNCVAWQQTAEYINNNLKKGDYVCIDGRITNRSYTNTAGQKAYAIEVVVDSIRNLGSKKARTEEETVPIDNFLEKKVNIENAVHSDNLANKTHPEIVNDLKSDSVDWDDEEDLK